MRSGVFPQPLSAGSCKRLLPTFNQSRAEAVARVILIVTILVALTVVAAFALARRLQPLGRALGPAADHPVPFGYKMAWLAIRTSDTAAVIDTLALRHVRASSWRTGLGAAYDESDGETLLFVSPPVDDWTFVIGLGLPHPLGCNFVDKATPLLLSLGSRFGDVQYFFSYPPIDFFAWARVADGRLVRAFAAADEGVIWNKGRPSQAERTLGLKLFELRGVNARRGDVGGALVLHPTEERVMRVAATGVSIRPASRRADQALGSAILGSLLWVGGRSAYVGRLEADSAAKPTRLRPIDCEKSAVAGKN